MIETAAGWIAPAATMIAAVMTAANLGARVTGWGFAVFSIGAVAWIVVAAGSGQQNLLASNAFLLVINVFGIWRWLGRRARYDEGAEKAVERSAQAAAPTLFALGTLEGRTVFGADRRAIAVVVDAMAACAGGQVAYLVVSAGGIGGIGEQLHALGWSELTIDDDGVHTRLDTDALAGRPTLRPNAWPTSAEAAGVA